MDTAETWLAAHWWLLLSATRAVLSGPLQAGDAEDAAQDAALAIWLHWEDGFDPRLGTRERWAYAIARRRAIDYQRRHQRRQRVAARIQMDGHAAWWGHGERADVEHLVGQRDELQRAWRALTPAERHAATLLAAGYTCAAAAATLDCPVGTLKSRLWHMRRRLGAATAAPEPAL
jgi:RNA polymerase sigma factor (sigma-70 family)